MPWRFTFWRFVTTRLSTWTVASLMSSSRPCVLPLRTAKPISADDRREETERGAVHGFGDTFGEDARLLARIDRLAGDGAEGLDQTDDGAEEAGEHREVREQGEEARALAIFGISRRAASSIAA